MAPESRAAPGIPGLGNTAQTGSVGRYRWTICALLFFATTINYMDRSVLGVLGPTLQYHVFHWTDKDYATINMAFKVAYAIGLLTMGAVVDRFGTRLGYTVAIAVWSIFGMLHAAVRPGFSLLGFSLARFGLGLGESGNFPAAIKTVGEWFPKKERAFATGIFNAGSNVGAILAPSIIPLIVLPDGTNWQYAFFTTGVFSALWLIAWLKIYKRPEVHPSLSPAELAYINSDSTAETSGARLPWSSVLPLRETWAFAAAKITDAAWWFYLFWAGKFLFDQFGLNIKSLALPLIMIYVIADIGSVGGGWLSSHLIKRGWSINRARKTTLFICAICILPVMFTTRMGTRFEVNSRFFERLQSAKVTVMEVTNQNGHTVRSKSEQPVGAAAIETLHTLEGQSFASAKEFLKAAREKLGSETTGRIEAALIASARSDNMYWLAVLLISLAAAGHQAWSANVFTLVSDVFPKKATASVIGIGGMVGAVSGIVADFSLGQVLSSSGPSGYFFAFLVAGSCYLILLGVVHVLMPQMTPLDDRLQRVTR
ncbi:MAG TPA: MFS transporter [Candidatus Dormibacteraeota bacterium]|nr:MFS transporter [Candidatus Dormibacteraeota bacterium]